MYYESGSDVLAIITTTSAWHSLRALWAMVRKHSEKYDSENESPRLFSLYTRHAELRNCQVAVVYVFVTLQARCTYVASRRRWTLTIKAAAAAMSPSAALMAGGFAGGRALPVPAAAAAAPQVDVDDTTGGASAAPDEATTARLGITLASDGSGISTCVGPIHASCLRCGPRC